MKYLGVSVILSALISCTVIPAPLQVNKHDLGPSVQQKSTLTTGAGVLNVDAPEWLWDNRIRYRLLYSVPTRIRFYSRDNWIAPVPALLQHHIILPEQFSCVLNVRLLDFEQQFMTANQAQVVLKLSLNLRSKDNKKLLSKTELSLNKKSALANALGAVNGFSELTQQANKTIYQWLQTQAKTGCLKF